MAESKPIDRPFTDEIMSHAGEIARTYRYDVRREDGEWIGSTRELPLVFGDGETADDCSRSAIEATTIVIATLLEQGETPPEPSPR